MSDEAVEARPATPFLRRLQAWLLIVGGGLIVVTFYVYMIPGLSEEDGFGVGDILFLSPIALALGFPFALHWFIVRNPAAAAVTASLFVGISVLSALSVFTGSDAINGFGWVILPIFELILVALAAAVGGVASAATYAHRKLTDDDGDAT